jgi:signal transduction histidine kinase
LKSIPNTTELEGRSERDSQVFACLQQVLGHDLVNHLVAAQGLAQLLALEESARLKPESKIYLERLVAAIGRVHGAVATMAEVCKVRGPVPQFESVLISEVAREVAAEMSKLYPDRPVEYAIADGELTVLAPRASVRRIVSHLIRNAIQARREGSPSRIEVGTCEESASWWVADNGKGMTPELLEYLRDFFAGRIGTRPGGGLGLLLVRESVDSIGGSLHIDSSPGCGAIFTIHGAGAITL